MAGPGATEVRASMGRVVRELRGREVSLGVVHVIAENVFLIYLYCKDMLQNLSSTKPKPGQYSSSCR